MTVQARVESLFQRFIALLRTELGVTIGLAVVVGAVAGLGAVGFRYLIREIEILFFDGGAHVFGFMGPYYVIVMPAIGGLFVGLIVYFFAREVKGHGVPEVMAAVAAKGGRIRQRVSVMGALATSICIGSGGSAGREGPIVLIGSSLGSTIGQRLKLHEDWIKTLVACGAAGGIAATFNAPIAGVFFAHEVILHRFITPSFIPVVLSSVIATMVSRAFLGDNPSFLIPTYSLISGWEILLYMLLGVIAAVIAVAFIRSLYKCEDLFDAWKFPGYLKPILGGLLVGLIGYFYFDIFGVGYSGPEYAGLTMMYGSAGYGAINKALLGQIGLGMLVAMMVLKIVATSATLGSGGSGGVFAPSLFMGAMLGGAFGIGVNKLFPAITAFPGAYAVVGMAAVFAAAARAPITAFIILIEMTGWGEYQLILPLLMAVVVSTVVSRRLNRETIYTTKVLRMGIDLNRREVADIMKGIPVSEVMTHDFPTVLPEMSVEELSHKLTETGHHGFPVVDKEGCLCGVVTMTDVRAAMERGSSARLTVNDIATKNAIVAYPDQSLHDALVQFGGRDVGRIPVVDRNDQTKLLGVLRRHDILKAYTKEIAEEEGSTSNE
jgi:CIC family chloride channel protein